MNQKGERTPQGLKRSEWRDSVAASGGQRRLVLEKKETEVSALVIGAATVLLLGSALLSLLWFNRMV